MNEMNYQIVWDNQTPEMKATLNNEACEATRSLYGYVEPIDRVSLDYIRQQYGDDVEKLLLDTRKFNPQDRWFTVDGEGHIVSAKNIDDLINDTPEDIIEAIKDFDPIMYGELLDQWRWLYS